MNPTYRLGLGSVDVDRGMATMNRPMSPSGSRQKLEDIADTRQTIMGIPLYRYSQRSQFLICSGGVMAFYMVYGYVQEAIFRIDGMKPHGWYLTLVQFAMYTVFGCTEKLVSYEERRIPFSTYLFLAFLTVATMGLSNSSVGYLNYPTQVIFKSCKLIPVMIGSVIIVGRRYGMLDVSAVLLMCIGLTWFTLADSSISPAFNQTGVILISLALCADAAIGNYQEKAMKKFQASNTEVVLYSYSIGCGYLFVGLLLSGTLGTSFSYFNKNGVHKYFLAGIFAFTGYMGIKFVLLLVRMFGALVAVTVTTLRKALTITLSFLLFAKPFTIQYLISGFVILAGVALNVYSKNKSQLEPWLLEKWHTLRKRHPDGMPTTEVV